jgi:hypothetical protein
MKKHLSEGQKEVVQYAIDGIMDIHDTKSGYDTYELFQQLFNEDYFIVGYYAAEHFLIRWGGVFKAIGEVMDNDKEHFGQVTTNLSSAEDVANMLAYIEGERFLNECPTFVNAFNGSLSNDDLLAIVEELKEL